MEISDWEVEDYRSIAEGQFSPGRFNILIGRNNTGKSNIIRSITDFAAQMTGRSQDHYLYQGPVFDREDDIRDVFGNPDWERARTRNGQSNNVRQKLTFDLDESEREIIFSVLREKGVGDEYIQECRDHSSFSSIIYEFDADGRHVNHRIQTELPRNGMTVINDRIDSNISIYYSGLSPEEINQSQSTDDVRKLLQHLIVKSAQDWHLASAFRNPVSQMVSDRAEYLESSGENLVQVLDTLADNSPDIFHQIEDTYTDVMEGVTGIRTPFVNDGNTRSVVIDEEGYEEGFRLEEISGGSREILVLLTQIALAQQESDLLLIEEPELHIHPSAQQALYDLVQDVCSNNGPQVILSTHSSVFLDNTSTENVIHVSRDVETEIEPVEDDIEPLLRSIGHTKSDLLQSKGAVFVEGPSDRSVLTEFSNTLASAQADRESIDDSGIILRPLGGDRMKRHGRELHNSLSHMRIPHFFLADSDDESPDEKRQNLSEKFDGAEVHVLEEYCIESYLLENPYAIAAPFDLDEEAVRQYIEDAQDRPNKKRVLDDLLQEVAGRESGYDEREHSWIIARKVNPEDIPNEIEDIIERVEELSPN